jgi:hypothetical protein
MSNPEPSDHLSSPDPIHQDSYPELDFNSQEHQLLSCPKCNHLIGGNEVNIEKTIAHCTHCGHIFGFAHDSKSGRLKPERLIPEGIEVLRLRSELDVSLDWKKTTSKGGRKFFTLFTFAWNTMLLPFLLVGLLMGNWGILLFLSLHLLVGMGLLWYIAAIYFNRSTLTISDRKLRVQSGPVRLPVFKNREISTDQIDQFYVSRYTASTTNGVPNYAYALYVILKSGERISLLRGMNWETQQYLEQEIEAYLGIMNKTVENEFKAGK